MAAEQDGSSALSDAYAVDFARPFIGWGGGGRAYAAAAHAAPDVPLIATLVAPGRAPRARLLASETGAIVPGVLMPVAHGRLALPGGAMAWAVVTAAPPGPSVAAPAPPWTEAELHRRLLGPVAAALARLHARGVHHRGIRCDNLFASSGQGCVLGPAWAEPPASLQPAVYEPPYSAMCLPCGRGDGAAGDDVYALGAVALSLATGRMPLADLDEAEIIRRKLDLGSYGALAAQARLSPALADLLRAMLAEDPAHRPSAALLADPVASRGRRAYARPPRRAARPLLIRDEAANDARALAWAIARDPAAASAHLRGGVVEHWLRRELGDAGLAQTIEEMQRQRRAATASRAGRADALLATRVIAALDPLAPLCWDGIAWWPDAMGDALGAADPDVAGRIEAAVRAEASAVWAGAVPDRKDAASAAAEARRQHALLAAPPPAGGRARLMYALCPLLACAAPVVAERAVTRLGDVLPALEAAAGDAARLRDPPLDGVLTAFIAARSDQQGDGLAAVIERGSGGDRDKSGDTTLPALVQLRLLAALQTRTRAGPLPKLAAWVVAQAAPLVDAWRHAATRAAIAARLASLAVDGQLPPILALLDDPAAQAADAQGALAARGQVAAIDAALRAIAEGAVERADAAMRLGQELAVGAGMTALAGALALLALG